MAQTLLNQSIEHRATNPQPGGRLSAVVSALLALLVGLMTSGLVLAMIGLHHSWLQAPLAAIAAAALYRHLPRQGDGVLGRPITIILTVLVAGVIFSNMLLHSELVIGGRDGATYANTASFLVEDGGLFPQAVQDPFVGLDLDFGAPGFVVRDDGTYWQQFLHAISSVYAFFGELFGKSALFVVNAFLSGVGLLVLFALARRFVAPWWALLATAITAVCLPYIYYSRGTFSEIATLVLALGGLWAAHVALTESPGVAAAAGLLLGAATMIRVDAWFLGVALGALLVTTTWMGEPAAGAVTTRMFNGFALTAALGLVDLIFFSEPYLSNVGSLILALIVAAMALRLAAPLAAATAAQRLMELIQRQRRHVATVLSLAITVGIGFLWFIRPLLSPSLSDSVYGVAAIQIREGLPVEPTRIYSELSVWWLTWYLGIPFVAAGFAGVIAATRRAIVPGEAALRFMVLAFLVPAATYLTRPSINPDHIWAIRRFVPIVIPGLVIFAIAVAATAFGRLPPVGRSRPLAGAVIAAAVIPIALASAPLIDDADRAGVAGQLERICSDLGSTKSVLIVDDDPEVPLSWLIGPPLRSWCGLSVAAVAADGPGPVDAPVRVGAVIAGSPDLLPTSDRARYELSATAWQSRLTGPPNRLETRSIVMWIGRP